MRTLESATVVNATHDPILYDSAAPLNITGTRRVYATSLSANVTEDACQPLPDDTPDLKDYVVLIRRGVCPFTTKFDNAAKKGARYFLVYKSVLSLLYCVVKADVLSSVILLVIPL